MEHIDQEQQTFYKEIELPIDLSILRHYHPCFEINYNISIRDKISPLSNQVFLFSLNVSSQELADEWSFEKQEVINSLQRHKNKSLTQTDLGNLIYIIGFYINLQPPTVTKGFADILNEFNSTIKNLFLIEEHLSKLDQCYMAFDNRKYNKRASPIYLHIDDKKISQKVLNDLKKIYFKKLIAIQLKYNSLTDNRFVNQLGSDIDIAVSMLTKTKPNSNPQLILKDLYKRTKSKLKHRIWDKKKHEIEFRRMLFKTLMDYLDKETSMRPVGLNHENQPKKTTDLQYQTIYHLCSIFDLVERTNKKTDQKNLIKDIVKYFKVDHRFKLAKMEMKTFEIIIPSSNL